MKKRGRDSNKQKIIAVIGPTASGKTDLAIKIAMKFNGELINTDSRQIYKYMDIGTAKGDISQSPITNFQLPKKSQISNPDVKKLDTYKLEGVPIHLVNIVDPDDILSLAQYQRLAYAAIYDVMQRGKLPILVGGTGLYIDAITKGYMMPKVKPNRKLRDELESLDIEQLQNQLVSLNKTRYEELNNSDRNNPRRLVRIIEIETKIKDEKPNLLKKPPFKVLFLTPERSREELYDRINKRSKIILKSGLIDEVKELIKKGYSFSKPALSAISYPLVKQYLNGEIDKEELEGKFAQGDRNYASRQITWFKRYKAIEVKDINKEVYIIKRFLENMN